MVNSKQAVGLVVGLVVASLLAAFLMPVVVGQFDGTETSTYTQSTGETVELQPDLEATLDSTTAGTSATYTINASGDTASTTVNVGSNQTVTVDGTDVTIQPTEANSGNATTEYTYDGTYGWGTGAGSIWTIIPILLVLAVFLYFVGMATGQL